MHISLHRDDDVIRKACFCCHVFCFAFAPDEPLPRQDLGDGETHPEQTRLSARFVGRGREDRSHASGAAVRGVGVKARLRRECRVSSEQRKLERRRLC